MLAKKIAQELVARYLQTSQIRNPFVRRAEQEHTPPTPLETQELIAYLRSAGLKPVIVGSVALVYHLGLNEGDLDREFRPTKDIDIFVYATESELPSPPQGWHQDTESIGVTSWISPNGGYVDFLLPKQELPDGRVYPRSVGLHAETSTSDYPVTDVETLFRLKLMSFRESDLFDLIALARKTGIPNLQNLDSQQKENLELIKHWLQARPKGAYGE